ncbi:MAG: livH [Candidatus Eremiobacteraeota bacterium]|nr:livH [Candidatus Eremiobacteraeota bacterium]
MHLFFQELLNGLVVGSLYALVALGLALIYGTMQVPNFAHGHLYMLGAYVAFFGVTVAHIGYWPSMLLAIVVLALVGILLERLVFRPLSNAPEVNTIIAAVGVLFFLQTLAQVWFGGDYRVFPSPYDRVVHFAGLVATQQQLIIIVAAAVLMVALFWFLKRTLTGATIEAVAQNRAGAALVGIDTNRVSMMVFAISAGLAAAAATLIASISLISPSMGFTVILKAFAIIVLGGMGSVPGAIIGAYILAFAESFAGTYISSNYQDAIAFGVLVLILTFKPTGLFAKGT